MPTATLQHAETSLIRAFLVDQKLLIYVEGYSSGYGGSLLVERSPNKSLPPTFDVYAVPGNMGINPSEGPTHVPEWVMATFSAAGIADEIDVVDASGSQIVAVKQAEGTVARSGKAGEWLAIHNLMPGTGGALRVSGVLEAPRPGYSVELKPAVPQGINPGILLLDLIVTEPQNPGIALMEPLFARFELKTRQPYTDVTIIKDGALMTEDVTIRVEVAQ